MTDLYFRLNVDEGKKAELGKALEDVVEGHTTTHKYHPGEDFTRIPGNIRGKAWTMYDFETGAIALRYSVEDQTPSIPPSKYKGSKSYRREEPAPAMKRVTVQIRLHGVPEGTPAYKQFWDFVQKLRDEYPETQMRFGAEITRVSDNHQ